MRGKTPSSSVALGAATIFIVVATTLGLLPDPTARLAPGTAIWQLRGTLPPQDFQSFQGPLPA